MYPYLAVIRDSAISVAFLGLATGATAAFILLSLRLGFARQDVSAFAGAVAGAAFTVVGTAWLSQRSTTAAKRQEQALLYAECGGLLSLVRETIATGVVDNEVDWNNEFLPALRKTASAASEVLAVIEQAVVHARALDFRQRALIIHARTTLKAFRNFYDEVFAPHYVENPYDERDWPGLLRFVEEGLHEAVIALR